MNFDEIELHGVTTLVEHPSQMAPPGIHTVVNCKKLNVSVLHMEACLMTDCLFVSQWTLISR